NAKTLLLYLLSIFMLAFFFYVIYQNNLFEIKNTIDNSNLVMRSSIVTRDSLSNNSRFDAWQITVKSLATYPFGGSKVPIRLSSTHYLWLDIAYTTGLIPFVIFIYITFIYINVIYKLLNLNIKNSSKLLLFAFNI